MNCNKVWNISKMNKLSESFNDLYIKKCKNMLFNYIQSYLPKIMTVISILKESNILMLELIELCHNIYANDLENLNNLEYDIIESINESYSKSIIPVSNLDFILIIKRIKIIIQEIFDK